jgi:osmotically-inducible protein OsmY
VTSRPPWDPISDSDYPSVHQHPYNDSWQDRILCRRVAAELMADRTLRTRDIHLIVHNRVVILEGSVAGPAAKQRAGEIACNTSHVFDVSNRLKPR